MGDPPVATGPPKESSVFRVDAAKELEHPHAGKRLRATRSTSVCWGTGSDADTARRLVAGARSAWAAGHRRVAVIANTVALAQAVYTKLRESAKQEHPAEHRIELITSRFRGADLLARGSAWMNPDTPCTTVATQTIEVGVDVTFDALVTEACPWNSLVQRLGRLNRDGKLSNATAEVVCGWKEAQDTPVVRSATQSVYGAEPVEAAIRLLRTLTEEHRGAVNLSTESLLSVETRADFDRAALEGPPPRFGTLTSSMLPLITQTRPTPQPDIPLEALISGPDASVTSELMIAWRANLEVLDAAPHTRVDDAELVVVPRSALRSFLRGNARAAVSFADTGSTSSESKPGAWRSRFHLNDFRVWDTQQECWRRPLDGNEVERATQLVMRPALRGYNSALGWTGNSDISEPEPEDLSLHLTLERILSASTGALLNRPFDLVISAETLDSLDLTGPVFTPDPRASSAFTSSSTPSTLESLASLVTQLRDALKRIESERSRGVPVEELDSSELLEAGKRFAQTLSALSTTTSGGALGLRRLPSAVLGGSPAVCIPLLWRPAAPAASAETILLDDHQRQVAAWAYGDARALGLTQDLACSLGIAGRLHDEGKRDEHMQREFGAEPNDPPLAKPLPAALLGSARRRHRVGQSAAARSGWRHEADSLARIGCLLNSLELHLIGAHHGFFRPIMKPLSLPTDSSYPAPLSHADEFAELNARYGPWGLALLETVLRLADWRASARPQTVTSDPHLPSGYKVTATGRADSAPGSTRSDLEAGTRGTDTGGAERFIGLHTHPLTGWFAAVALLATAHESGDRGAQLRWEPLGDEGAPLVPALESAVESHELIEQVLRSQDWWRTEELLQSHGFAGGLSIKNQKLQPAERLRELLLEADVSDSPTTNRLATGLIGDLTASTGTSHGRQVEMPLVAFASNSSYPASALRRLQPDRRETSIREAVESLHSDTAGYESEKCDGGMDRSPVMLPGVTGLGDAKHRQTRVALAPLALFGMSRIGSGTPRGVGVLRSRLLLPVPTEWVSFHQLRAMTLLGHGAPPWHWESCGQAWAYEAEKYQPSRYERIWQGMVTRRSLAPRSRPTLHTRD